ncbi:hypothetical protein SAMN05421833_1087 [Microbispora rosea]|uniref:Secreted protein n=1 Tax=Microbispora rosea TaxID=58117 RepID=A0A1N7A3D8_9ACTN|nr:hypothetical protein [Microbispora rosea]SIR33604.1 hypothetical protein SAMN05421833_1087 [Microbispora rosea]
MRRTAGYLIAWCGATALAVGVSWLGVRDVLRSAILDEAPLAPVVAVAAPLSASPGASAPAPRSTPDGGASGGTSEEPSEEPSGPRPSGGATPGRPSPSRPAATPVRTARTSPAPRPARATRPARSTESSPAARQPKATGGERLHTFTLKGGRATIAVTSADCRVVTATPNDGYEVKVWEADQWLRVAFLQDTRESSAFCTWNALPPRLDTYEN